MRIHYTLAGLIALALTLSIVGCSGSSATIGSAGSPFAGNYSGSFSDTPSGQVGTYSITINSQGGLYGTSYNSTTTKYGQVLGTIDDSGNAVFNISYGNVTTTEQGVLTAGANQALGGTLTGPQTETVALSPTKV